MKLCLKGNKEGEEEAAVAVVVKSLKTGVPIKGGGFHVFNLHQPAMEATACSYPPPLPTGPGAILPHLSLLLPLSLES